MMENYENKVSNIELMSAEADKGCKMKLRRLEEKDADGMLEWMQDPEIQKRFRFNAEGMDKEAVLSFIREANTCLIDGKDIHYAVSDENDGYLGTISLKNIDLSSKNAEYAISLRRIAQGKGIAAKATNEILRIAFEQYALEKVYLNVLADNQKAIRFYEKCGFIYEGEFRKHLFLRGEYKTLKWYSMLKEEWKKGIGSYDGKNHA